jgi:hypothetical protein
MPTKVSVIHARDFIRATPEGAFDFERSNKLLAEIAAAGAGLNDCGVILDTRKVESGLSPGDLWFLAARLAEDRKVFARKTAVLCPAERFERATFFSLCAENRGLNVRPLVSYEDAIEWLIADEP